MLEQEVNRLKGLVTTRNLFYDLPSELQTKIHKTNVLRELPFNSFLVRKQQFVEAVEKATNATRPSHVFVRPRGSGFRSPSPCPFNMEIDKQIHAVTLRSHYYTDAWFESKGREIELDDVCLCSLSSQDLDRKRLLPYQPMFRGKKKGLWQLCEDNGIKWCKGWSIMRLNKALMTI